MKFKKIVTDKAPEAIGPYSQGIAFKNILFTSGQIPINKELQIIPDGIFEQTRVCLQNIKFIVEASNFKINEIIKIIIYTTQLEKLEKINDSYRKFFDSYKMILPARTCIGVSKLPKNVSIEIEAIALKSKQK
ncbi:Rid family detoxifying hydrolase [Buchnera aphidicola]|uniref:Rid family detoxifying hydrolase n=1 Tax=Buchnera aphidicola TaxID=9 RepID=UPI0031B693E0